MNHKLGRFLERSYFSILAIALSVFTQSALAGTFPTTGNNATDPYLIMRASGNACGEGDSVTCTGTTALTSNKYYSFFIEVPPSTGELRIELFDADVGLGGAAEVTAGRDTAAASYNYTLINPASGTPTTRFNRGTSTNTGLIDAIPVIPVNVDCQPGVIGGIADNAWCLLFAQSAPLSGHWEVRMASNVATAQVTAVGLRARDTVTGRDLNVYARSYIHYGNQNANARRSYTQANGNNVFYPYVTAGCSLRAYDFDSDNDPNQIHTFDYLGTGSPLTVTQTNLNVGFSGNDQWNSELIAHASDTAAQRYGMWRFQGNSGTTSNHVEIWASPETINLVPPTTQPTAGSFRYYFPRNDGTTPIKPIFRHSVTSFVSGASTPTIGSPTRLRIGLAIRNPTPYPINFNSSNLVSVNVPASDANATRRYKGNFTTNCGAVVIQPAIDATGALTWNPGTLPTGSVCDATYEIEVQPITNGRHLLTGPTASGTTANMLDETGVPFTFGPLCEMAVQTGTSYSTVPVTLSNVDVSEVGSDLVVNFNTAAEAGTLGFRVLADIGKGVQARVEIGSVASKAIDSLKEQSYSVRTRNPGADQVWIEESAVDGKATLYGPYKVGSSVGEVGLAQPLNWAAVNAEQLNFRAAQSVALRGINAKAAEIRVSSDAWVRVTQAQLQSAGVDLSGQPASNISVRSGSEIVPARVNLGAKTFGAGSTIEFFAKAVQNSLYTTTAVYRIEIGRALSIAEIDARTTGQSVGPDVQAVADTLLLNANIAYSFSSPLEDPWYSFRALRSGSNPVGVGSINFTLKDRVASFVEGGSNNPSDTHVGTEAIEVSFWGGLDYAGSTPDHYAVFKLNDVTLGSVQFDGFAARVERFALPAGVLSDTTNTFTVELPSGTGYAADIVNVESVKVSYMRKLIPQTDRISVLLPVTPTAGTTKSDAAKASDGADKINASTFVISGLSGAPVVAVLERAGVHSVLTTDAISSGSLRIELAALAGDRVSLMPVENGLLPTAALAFEDPIAGVDKASYLIISHPSFIANLSPLILAKQQQGFSVKVVDVEAIYRYYSAGVIDPAAIQLAIRRAQQRLKTTHVLLVGGDTYDYHNVLGVNSVSFIPTNYRRIGQIIAFAPSDVVYADTDANGVANLAIGRWPVRTNAELNALLAKTLSYQNTRKALFISDRSLNGISYANQAAPLANLLGQDWTTSQLSLDSYAAGQAATARADIIRNLEGGTSLLSYYGHSAPASWSREGLITASQVSGDLFNTVNQPFVAVQLGCWGTYFVEPSSTTVAHQMLLMQKGAAAVLGATSLTESNSDLVLANHLLPRLSSTTLGDALLQAQQAVATELPNAQDVILGGTLLGDPGLR